MSLDVVILSPDTQYERVLLSSPKMNRYNKKVDEVHHHYYFYYDSPGYPPTLPPMGAPVKIIPYPHLPAGPWVTPAARASSEMFTPQVRNFEVVNHRFSFISFK